MECVLIAFASSFLKMRRCIQGGCKDALSEQGARLRCGRRRSTIKTEKVFIFPAKPFSRGLEVGTLKLELWGAEKLEPKVCCIQSGDEGVQSCDGRGATAVGGRGGGPRRVHVKGQMTHNRMTLS